MDKFLVVHAVGEEGDAWKKLAGSDVGYVPQTYWFSNSGKHLDIAGPNAKYKHFFSDDSALANAMTKADLQRGQDEL